jgi:CheY-like chemotaxis protein
VVIELRRELAAHLPAVLGAESELREALTNLIFNAIDAMPVGGTLTLRTRTEASHVQIEVGDTGIGMNEDTRRRCLEPFFTTKGERGTGLGLAMVYGIVRRHGAEIEIESSEGRGTLFRLVLTVPEKGVSTEPARVDSQPEIPSGLRLLVIDDDPLLIASLRQVLEGDGNAVVTANSGQAGIDVFLKAQTAGEPFNVVITDLGMPHVDGRKVATAIKAASPATPVILLSGWGQRLLAEGNIPAHVDCVLPKPPRLPELRAALMRCSQKKRRTDDSSGRTTR